MRIIKLVLVTCLTLTIIGCKITIIANEGGSVVSQSGLRNCPKGTICPNEITSPTFSETFTALPEPGYEFVRWHGGDGFFCGDSTGPTCTIALAGNPLDAYAITTLAVVYAMPVFEQTEPILDSDGDGLNDTEDPFPNDPYNIPPGSIVAVDLNGLVWGPVVEEGQNYINVSVKFDGAPDPYMLKYQPEDVLVASTDVYFEAAGCDPDAGKVYVNSAPISEGLEVNGPTADSRYLIPDELAFEVFNPAVLSRLNLPAGTCVASNSASQWYTQMKAVGPLDIAVPIHKEYR